MRYKKPPVDPYKNITYGSTKKEDFTLFLSEDTKEYPIKVESVGVTYPDKEYFIAREYPHYFVVEYVEAGKGFIEVGDKRYDVEADCVYILPPGIKHRYGADQKEPFQKIWLNCFSGIMTDFMASYGLNGKIVFPNSHCKKYFDELLEIAKDSPINKDYNIDISRVVFNLLLTLAKQLTQNDACPPLIQKAKRRLDSAVYRKETVDNLCSTLNISRSQLCREFKKHFGVTPYQYLLSKKLNVAKQLLLMTNMKIQEISETLCFSDEYNFSNVFKGKVGQSPQNFRISNKAKPLE